MVKAEKVIIEDFSIRDILKEDFIQKIDRLGLDLFPVSIVFINKIEKNGKKLAYPLLLSHESDTDFKSRLLHIESPNTDLVEYFTKMLEKK